MNDNESNDYFSSFVIQQSSLTNFEAIKGDASRQKLKARRKITQIISDDSR
jgi:hypothetical protein